MLLDERPIFVRCEKIEALKTQCFQGFMAGAEGLEPSARGFGAALECPETVVK